MPEIDYDKTIKSLRSELEASIAREAELRDNLSVGKFVKYKLQKTSIYRAAKNPNSKFGKILRLPRTTVRIIKNPKIISNIRKKKVENNVLEKKNYTPDKLLLEPWKISIEDRLKIFETSKKSHKKIALYFVEKPDSSTFRYRCYNTFQNTKSSSNWQAIFFYKNELQELKNLIKDADLLILGRQSGQEKNISGLVSLAHEHHIRTALDIDDLVFDTSYLNSFLENIGELTNRSYWATYFSSIEYIGNLVDAFISTNEFLSERLNKKFKKPCYVIPNFLNAEQVSASTAYLELKKSHEDFTIGYFSGSPTHAKDLALVMPSILKFLKIHKDAKLMVVGYMNFDDEANKYLKNGQIIFRDMVDFRKLQRLNTEVDVNIAPLVENDFTNCKSELKFFEAAIVEVPTLASPTFAFKNSIKNGETGFLCKKGEWFDRLEYLYNNPEKREEIGKAAKKYCLENYYGEKIKKQIEEVYDELAK